MHEPLITVAGNVAGPPRHRTTPGGVAVADFRIAATPRRLDRATAQWGDGETIWFGVTTWRSLADHCAASIGKGDRVVVTGRLTTRSYEVEGGERRTGLEVDATSVGLDLSKGTATYVKVPPLQTDADPWAAERGVDPATGEMTGGPLPEEPTEDAERSEELVGAAS